MFFFFFKLNDRNQYLNVEVKLPCKHVQRVWVFKYSFVVAAAAAVMSSHLVLMVCLTLALALCSRGGEARVRLNAIRTVILTEGHALPVNRSAWEPNLDLTVSVCL